MHGFDYGNDFSNCDDSIKLIPVVRRDDGVLLSLLHVAAVPLADAWAACIRKYDAAEFSHRSRKSVALDSRTNLCKVLEIVVPCHLQNVTFEFYPRPNFSDDLLIIYLFPVEFCVTKQARKSVPHPCSLPGVM